MTTSTSKRHPVRKSRRQTSGVLRVAVISDLHAYDEATTKDAEAPSYLRMGAPEDQPTRHPIAGLNELIAREQLNVDFLICCGDIGDKARPAATKYAWQQIDSLRRKLTAHTLIATPGNHDMDSRHLYNSFDAKGTLQALVPTFPLACIQDSDRFWSRNFAVVERDAVRIVVLNSSAYHGTATDELKHGRLAASTLQSVTAALQQPGSYKVNVLVCHHHPQRYGDIESEDYSEMQGGDALLAELGSGRSGRWLIIHGHKHHPRMCYGPGTASAPIIFSAGSLCGAIYRAVQGKARNQFYVIEVPWRRFDALELELAGRFWAWDWINGMGWQPAGPESGLPGRGGFGYRPELEYEAARIAGIVKKRRTYVHWSEVLRRRPQLEFIMPADLMGLRARLLNKHAVEAIADPDGTIRHLAVASG